MKHLLPKNFNYYLIFFFYLLFFSATNSHSASFKVASFNTGLAHGFIPYAKKRLPAIIKSIKESNNDIICLQEVWKKKDRKKIINSLQKKYPYIFYSSINNTRTKKNPSCYPWDLIGTNKFINCMATHCLSDKGAKFTNCIAQTCKKSLTNLKNNNRQCAKALFAQVGKTPLKSLITVLNPFKPANLFAYQGSNGLLLLSKIHLRDKKIFNLEPISTLTKRAVLQAKIKVNKKAITISCTHLTANLKKVVPYTGIFQSWGEENSKQITQLLKDTATNKLPHILMGDFNCSFGNKKAKVSSSLEPNCQKILDANFSISFKKKREEKCSFCKNNLFNIEDKGNVLIDHIFSKNITTLTTKIIYNQTIKISSEESTIDINLSDHYGIQKEFQIK